MTEIEMKNAEVPMFKTIEELTKYIDDLLLEANEYGKTVYVISMASLATYNYICYKVGATGFMASCADLDFLCRSRHLNDGFRLIDFNCLLYPQYWTKEFFPDPEYLLQDSEMREYMKNRAIELLEENKDKTVHPDVIEHWKKLSDINFVYNSTTNNLQEKTESTIKDLKDALIICIDALYQAIKIAPMDRIPSKAGNAIQQAQAVCDNLFIKYR